jgi:murein DD-endopeptidase MepM/ murein hydrolase activator NlpD
VNRHRRSARIREKLATGGWLLLVGAGLLAGGVTPGFTAPKSAAPAAPAGSVGTGGTPGGVCHVLRRGQTLYSLARAYRVSLDSIVEANQIEDPGRMPAGRVLFIPGAAEGPNALAEPIPCFAWPLNGRVTSRFGGRGRGGSHEGLDIDGVAGQVIRAAAAGRVAWAGEERGYGTMVILEHGYGLTTLYAHASRLLVDAGESVSAGEPIAEVGQSGNARGAHLHFEVRRDGRPVNPLPILGTVARASASR